MAFSESLGLKIRENGEPSVERKVNVFREPLNGVIRLRQGGAALEDQLRPELQHVEKAM